MDARPDAIQKLTERTRSLRCNARRLLHILAKIATQFFLVFAAICSKTLFAIRAQPIVRTSWTADMAARRDATPRQMDITRDSPTNAQSYDFTIVQHVP
jgi:hypothetical protein